MPLTMQKMKALRPELAKLAMEKYPPTKKERQGCHMEKARMEGLRLEYIKRLVSHTAKQEYDGTGIHTD